MNATNALTACDLRPITMTAIEDCAKGEFVRLMRAGKPTTKVYQVAGYCQYAKAYIVDDVDDISRDRALKKGTPVVIGFTY